MSERTRWRVVSLTVFRSRSAGFWSTSSARNAQLKKMRIARETQRLIGREVACLVPVRDEAGNLIRRIP